MLPVRRNASRFALRGSRSRAPAAVQAASRSAGDRVLLAGCTRSGFGGAALDIVLCGIVCFDHGPYSRS